MYPCLPLHSRSWESFGGVSRLALLRLRHKGLYRQQQPGLGRVVSGSLAHTGPARPGAPSIVGAAQPGRQRARSDHCPPTATRGLSQGLRTELAAVRGDFLKEVTVSQNLKGGQDLAGTRRHSSLSRGWRRGDRRLGKEKPQVARAGMGAGRGWRWRMTPLAGAADLKG